jgi:hypothetical protein
MGNNLWVQRFKAGEVIAVDPLFDEMFAPYATAAVDGFLSLDFGDGAAELYHRPGDMGAMFAHFGGEGLVAVLYDFLKRSRGSVAFWPEDTPCGAVGQASDLTEMHPGLIKTVDPRVVASPAALSSMIRGEGD